MIKVCGCLLLVLLSLPLAAEGRQENQEEHPIDKALGVCIDKDSSTAGMSDCIGAAHTAWDKELNKNYNKLMDALGPKEKQALKAAQLEWIKYRDMEFKLIDALYYGKEGTMYIPMHAEDRLRVVKKRAQELASYLEFYKDA